MRNSLFVDTSGWICVADAAQPEHIAVSTVYRGAIAQHRELVTTNYILTEIAALLPRRSRITQAQMLAFVDSLLTAPQITIVHIDPQLHAEAWAMLKAHADKEWSLVDAASFVVMSRRGLLEALATDHHFEQARFTCVPPHP